MSPQHLASAAEFCKLVGKRSLLEYLGVGPDADADQVQQRLRDRRRFMQGMQSNPKYRDEALFLIKNFTALSEVLRAPGAYHRAVARQQESSHLPIVEMTIRSVLKGGTLSRDQVDYLARNARELGVGADTFGAMLARLAREAGVPLPGAPVNGSAARPKAAAPPSSVRPDAATPVRRPRIARPPTPASGLPRPPADDLYGLLRVSPSAPRDAIYKAYRERFDEARTLPSRSQAEPLMDRLDEAWKVLSDPSTREAYDISRARARDRTGPPARFREAAPGPADTARKAVHTAPPVRPRSEQPRPTPAAGVGWLGAGGPVLEVAGDPVRRIRIGNEPLSYTLTVRNVGRGPMPGRVTTDEPWLEVTPRELDPSRTEQMLTVRVRPDVPGGFGSAIVSVRAEHGERADIVFEVSGARSLGIPFAFGVGLLALVLVALASAGIAIGLFRPSPPIAGSLTVAVDPTAEQVLLDGRVVGSGPSVFVAEPPPGPATLTVTHPNFLPATRDIVIDPTRSQVVPISLEFARPLDFRPRPEHRQASLDRSAVERVMGARRQAMDTCVAGIARTTGETSGSVRIHISPEGVPTGIEFSGAGAHANDVRDCLARQAAAAVFPPFDDGDYATVRYDYQVTENPKQ